MAHPLGETGLDSGATLFFQVEDGFEVLLVGRVQTEAVAIGCA
jgi:hypothetical protein